MEAFNNLDLLLRGFWLVAIPVTIIFLIQMVLTFIGSDASDGTSADFDGDFDGGDAPFQLFSFRNLMNFLLGFSWTGISFYKIIPNQTVLILLAVAVGGLFVYLSPWTLLGLDLTKSDQFRMALSDEARGLLV